MLSGFQVQSRVMSNSPVTSNVGCLLWAESDLTYGPLQTLHLQQTSIQIFLEMTIVTACASRQGLCKQLNRMSHLPKDIKLFDC